MARKQISEALFKKIVEGLEKLGISLSEVLGTRTGVKKIGKSLTTGSIFLDLESELRSRAEVALRKFLNFSGKMHDISMK